MGVQRVKIFQIDRHIVLTLQGNVSAVTRRDLLKYERVKIQLTYKRSIIKLIKRTVNPAMPTTKDRIQHSARNY